MELLAPAGSLECGIAGIQYGADALYLGMPQFSARADATNLTLDELAVLAGIAHKATPRRSLYVTVNTLLRQEEVPQVDSLLAELNDAGVDGLIVQDALVAGLVRRYFPGLKIHASTQMAIHNLEGALQAKAMGFTRVVLARELSAPEIAEIARKSGVELEVFIHGALCYSYSGLCLLSAAINGNSGNRGGCTYICRNRFKIQDESGKQIDTCCPMSMKDLALPDMLPALEKAGVASLKIEGRKKTPLYVAAVTNYYRKLLDGTFRGEERTEAELDVKTIFSRPWTRFFVQNPQAAGITDTAHLGPRGIDVGCVNRVRRLDGGVHRLRFTVKNRPIEKHDGLQIELPGTEKPFGFPVSELLGFTQAGQDKWTPLYEAPVGTTVEVPLPPGHPEIPAGARIFCASSQAVKRKYTWPEPREALSRRRIPLDVSLEVQADSVCVRCSCDGLHLGKSGVSPSSEPVSVECRVPMQLEAASRPERLEPGARQAFEKLGDTCYSLGRFEYSNPGGFFLPVSQLNDLRRQAVSLLEERRREYRREYADSVLAEIAPVPEEKVAEKPSLLLKIDRPFYLNLFSEQELSRVDELIFAIGRTRPAELLPTLVELSRKVPRERIRIALPVLSRPQMTLHQWKSTVAILLKAGWRRFEIGNIGALSLFPDRSEVDLTGDWPLYTMNTIAAETWRQQGIRRLTACPEDTEENLMKILPFLGSRLTVVVWQDTILARSAVCIRKSIGGFCPGKENCRFNSALTLTRGDGIQLRAVNDNCTTLLLETPPRNLLLRVPEYLRCGARSFRADFVSADYSPADVRRIWQELIGKLEE